jgi:hypothetical protein
MAGASLFTLLDDIASVLDDVSILTKLAAKKTAGVLGDDLALNAQQVTGVKANRELPVVWSVAKGSAVNKAILVPAALAISAWLPWAVTPLMMIGGAFLCYEGVEKLAHRFLHTKQEVPNTMPSTCSIWPIPTWMWRRWSATRSRARSARTSSCRRRSSCYRWGWCRASPSCNRSWCWWPLPRR